jgi:hypothetical protein
VNKKQCIVHLTNASCWGVSVVDGSLTQYLAWLPDMTIYGMICGYFHGLQQFFWDELIVNFINNIL